MKTKITCIIVDDEGFVIEDLSRKIAKISSLQFIQGFQNPHEAVSFLESNAVDLVFMDIEMQNYDINGLEIMNIFGDKFHYIITSGYAGYALEGYDYDVIDYLHKPYSFDRFLRTIRKAEKIILKSSIIVEDEKEPADIYIKSDSKYHKIRLGDIYYIESERNAVSIYTSEDRINLAHKTLKEIEEYLPKSFLRVHKSFIVSEDKIKAIENENIVLNKPKESVKLIPIGAIYKKDFINTIELKLLNKRERKKL